jgi:ribosomal protein S18 acetylase RimI-like enzyme
LERITLKKATIEDKSIAIYFDFQLDQIEHVELRREEKITEAISNEECFLILEDDQAVGFVIFDYRFFDQGWIELIVIDEKCRGKGIGRKVFDILCVQCKSDKVFTSTNRSNIQMQRALENADFTFAGELKGLDDGDPELFYYKKCNDLNNNSMKMN